MDGRMDGLARGSRQPLEESFTERLERLRACEARRRRFKASAQDGNSLLRAASTSGGRGVTTLGAGRGQHGGSSGSSSVVIVAGGGSGAPLDYLAWTVKADELEQKRQRQSQPGGKVAGPCPDGWMKGWSKSTSKRSEGVRAKHDAPRACTSDLLWLEHKSQSPGLDNRSLTYCTLLPLCHYLESVISSYAFPEPLDIELMEYLRELRYLSPIVRTQLLSTGNKIFSSSTSAYVLREFIQLHVEWPTLDLEDSRLGYRDLCLLLTDPKHHASHLPDSWDSCSDEQDSSDDGERATNARSERSRCLDPNSVRYLNLCGSSLASSRSLPRLLDRMPGILHLSWSCKDGSNLDGSATCTRGLWTAAQNVARHCPLLVSLSLPGLNELPVSPQELFSSLRPWCRNLRMVAIGGDKARIVYR